MLSKIFHLRLVALAFIGVLFSLPAHAYGWAYASIDDFGGYVDSTSVAYIDIDDYEIGWQAYVEGYLYANGNEFDQGFEYGDDEAEVDLFGDVSGYGGDILIEVYADGYEEYGDFDWYWLGEGYAYVYAGGPPPYISSIDPSYDMRGSSGTITINGSYLSTEQSQPYVDLDGTSLDVTYADPSGAVVQASYRKPGRGRPHADALHARRVRFRYVYRGRPDAGHLFD